MELLLEAAQSLVIIKAVAIFGGTAADRYPDSQETLRPE
jgi:hypothetical protein